MTVSGLLAYVNTVYRFYGFGGTSLVLTREGVRCVCQQHIHLRLIIYKVSQHSMLLLCYYQRAEL